MSEPATNKGAVAEQSQVRGAEMAPTALVKLVADLHPSLCHVSNMLALTPRPIPRWVRYGETIVERTIPYLRGRPGTKPGALGQLHRPS